MLPNRENFSAAESELKSLRNGNYELAGIVVLIAVVIASGVMAFTPNLRPSLEVNLRYLPEFFHALVTALSAIMIVLLCQRRALQRSTLLLMDQVRHSRYMETFSILDPVTQVFTRAYLDQMLEAELRQANVQGCTTTFLLIEGDAPSEVIRNEQFTIALSKMLKSTFRGSDIILRYSETRFLVTLPDTTEQQSQAALTRLQNKIDHFNLSNTSRLELAFVYGAASCPPGGNGKAVIAAAERNLQQLASARQPIEQLHGRESFSSQSQLAN